MKITVLESKKNKVNISEGSIFNAINDFILTTNFPKKLVLKKLDMIIEKRKSQVAKFSKILSLSKKAENDIEKQIDNLRARNSSEIRELIDFLS